MILTVTANPSLDMRYELCELRAGGVNRLDEPATTAGGKGLNVARVAAALGEPATAMGFVGGRAGETFLSLLPPCLTPAFVQTDGETRRCINLHDAATGGNTELLERGAPVSPAAQQALLAAFRRALPACSAVTLNGSLPPACPADFYAQLIALARAAGKPVLLDASGEALRAGVAAVPTLVKPNTDELAQLLGEPVRGTAQLLRAARALHEGGIPWVVLSLGKEGAAMVCAAGAFRARTPAVRAVNTVGCGDSMVAGFAVGIARGEAAETCLRMGMAAGAANAMNPATGSIRREDYDRLLPQIEIEPWAEDGAE